VLTVTSLLCLDDNHSKPYLPRSAEYSLPVKRNLESTRLELETCQKKLSQAESASIHLNAELERLKRVSESAREGEEMEKRAVEERCKRALMHLEAEAALRRQYEDKAARCDKAEEDAARLKAEVRN
jgi:hypothetical protein